MDQNQNHQTATIVERLVLIVVVVILTIIIGAALGFWAWFIALIIVAILTGFYSRYRG